MQSLTQILPPPCPSGCGGGRRKRLCPDSGWIEYYILFSPRVLTSSVCWSSADLWTGHDRGLASQALRGEETVRASVPCAVRRRLGRPAGDKEPTSLQAAEAFNCQGENGEQLDRLTERKEGRKREKEEGRKGTKGCLLNLCTCLGRTRIPC